MEGNSRLRLDFKRFAIRSLVFALGCSLGLSALVTESHAKDIGALGGNGGGPFTASCKSGDALVGIGIRNGTALDAVSAVCAFLGADKTRWAAPTTYTPNPNPGSPSGYWGGNGGGNDLLACNRNDAFVAVHVYSGKAGILYVVNHVSITCAALPVPQDLRGASEACRRCRRFRQELLMLRKRMGHRHLR